MAKVNFENTNYTQASLKKLTPEALLTLRNTVANTFGAPALKSLPEGAEGVATTWKVLERYAEENKEEKPVRIVKGALPSTVKRPTRQMFRKITKVSTPARCGARWDNYKDGMTILETIEGDNMTPLDVSFFVKEGWMTLEDATEEEFVAGRDAWYDRNGIENPAAAKAAKAAEREQLKAEKAAAAKAAKEEKAAKAAAAKAAKAEAAAAKKADA